MADTKISELTALSAAPAAGDLFAIVDVSDTTMAASGTTKKITAANLQAPRAVVVSGNSVTIDPAVHPSGTIIIQDGTAQFEITLPLLASQPAIGYYVKIVGQYDGGMGMSLSFQKVRLADGTDLTPMGNYAMTELFYLGSNVWEIFQNGYGVTPLITVIANADPA